jgi:hypothetical protein
MYFPEVLNTVNNEPEEYARVLCGFIARSFRRGETDTRAPLPPVRFLVDGSISVNYTYKYNQIIL